MQQAITANEPLLRRLARGTVPTISQLAKDLDRDPKNTAKAVANLADLGVLARGDELALTDDGRRALLALDVASGAVAVDASARLLRHDQLEPDPANPRKTFDEAELGELAASMEELGLLQPILVRAMPGHDGRFFIVAGERRWRAAGLLIDGGTWEPQTAIPCRLDERADAERALAAIVENLQRVGVPPLEEARALKALVDAGGATVDIAARIGRTQRFVQMRLQLLTLPAEAQAALASGLITVEQARAMAQTPREPNKTPAPAAPSPQPSAEAEPPPAEGTAEAQAVPPFPFEREPRPRELCMLVEIADKLIQQPYRPRYTRCGQHYPDRTNLATAHVQQFGGGFASGGGWLDCVSLHDKVVNWLVAANLYPTEERREYVLAKVRTNAYGFARATVAFRRGEYLTPWLNDDFRVGGSRVDADPEGGDESVGEYMARAEGDEDEPELLPASADEKAVADAKAATAAAASDDFCLKNLTKALRERMARERATGLRSRLMNALPPEIAHVMLDFARTGDFIGVAMCAATLASCSDFTMPGLAAGRAGRGRVLPNDVAEQVARGRSTEFEALVGAVGAYLAAGADNMVGFHSSAPIADEVTPRLKAAYQLATSATDREDADDGAGVK